MRIEPINKKFEEFWKEFGEGLSINKDDYYFIWMASSDGMIKILKEQYGKGLKND